MGEVGAGWAIGGGGVARGLLREHFKEVGGGELVAYVRAFKELVGKVALGGVQSQNLFFDGVCCYEMINCDLLFLTDSVRAVGGLLLNGRIPPWVEVYHVVCFCEV